MTQRRDSGRPPGPGRPEGPGRPGSPRPAPGPRQGQGPRQGPRQGQGQRPGPRQLPRAARRPESLRDGHPARDRNAPPHDRDKRPSRDQPSPRRKGPPRPPRRPRPPRWIKFNRGDPGRRLSLTFLAIVFVLTLFGGRLVQIQGLESGAYKTLAENERLQSISLPALRGTITGSNGQPLAMTIEQFKITADPPQITDKAAVAQRLAAPLGLPAAKILGLLLHPSSSDYVLLAQGVSAQNEAKISSITGIYGTATYARVYPDGDATANVVGFTNDGSGVITGQQGLEEEYNKLLNGTAVSDEMEVGAGGEVIPGSLVKATPAVNGSSIQLTIDPVLQFQAQQTCEERVDQLHAKDCTVVIMQPKTGDILAMAQWPTYNPSNVTNIAQTADLPIGDTFQPGSTAKVITAAAAFEHGGQTPQSTYWIPSSGVIYKGGQAIHDAEDDAGAHYTIAGIIANSSNIGMSEVATHISDQLQYQYLKNFGLDQPTGLGLPGESEGLLPPVSQWWASEHYTLAFGQGIAVNAVQMASVYATIANNGVRVQPRLVEGTTSPSGKYTAAAPSPQRKVIKPKTAKDLIQILQQVPVVDAAADGDAGIINGYAVAAKTGTSQETGPECKPAGSLCEYGASYIGMAPGNDPQVVVSVNVQDPDQNVAYYGDIAAGPAFTTVMKDAIAALQIPPQAGLEPPDVRLNAP